MASVEIIDADLRTVKLIHRPDNLDRRAPVRTDAGDIRWVPWGGFVRLEQAKQQLCQYPVLIEIVGWTLGSRWEFQRLADDEFLQGCLVCSVRGALTVFGVQMGRKPRIVHAPGKLRVTRYPPLGNYPP